MKNLNLIMKLLLSNILFLPKGKGFANIRFLELY